MKKLLLILLLIATNMYVDAAKLDIRRVEPMNWWTGMKNPVLQLMVYGEGISAFRPEVIYPGVSIDRTVTTVNPNYLFIYLTISPETRPGSFDIVFKDGKKVAGRYSYTLLQRREDSAEREGFDSSDAMYLLMPDRFANGDTTNDNRPDMAERRNRHHKNGRHGGDIQGIIDHLDYLQDLGITALWSTPLMEDNVPECSYHTYAISDYYRIDPRYGSNDDYRRLSAEARKRGIKLVMDVVTNHCGAAHWWMNDLPSPDWVHQFDEFTRSNYRIWTIQDPHASAIDRRLCTEGWFDVTMPDLNQSNPLLLDYFIQNCIWWIEYADLGGLRIDTYPYNDKEAMSRLCAAIMAEYPRFNIVGECWMHETIEVAYWQKGVQNPDGYVSELPCVMDFPLTDALCAFTHEKQDWSMGIMRPYVVCGKDYLYADSDNLLIFADNHDTERIWHILKNDIRKFKLVFTILATTRGIPQIYYGTEIMMSGEKQKGDGDIRRDFPGGWPTDKVNAFTTAGRTEQQNEVHGFMKKLLNWRKNNPVIHTGKLMHYVPEDECYVYFRYNGREKVMVVVNNADRDDKTLRLDRFAEMLDGVDRGTDVISGRKVELVDRLTIPAKTSMILELH